MICKPVKANEKERLERTIQAIQDEIYWGLRNYYVAKIIWETQIRLTPTFFDTCYFACLDQAALILSRIVLAKPEGDESINIYYLFEKARIHPELFQFASEGEIDNMVALHKATIENYRPFIKTLKEQRDRNIAHLDRKHVNQPEWKTAQEQIDLAQMERFYKDLVEIERRYYQLFYGSDISFGDWDNICHQEVDFLTEMYQAMNKQDMDRWIK